MNRILILHYNGTFDFEDESMYMDVGARLFQERYVEVSNDDLRWLQHTRKEHGWKAWNLQLTLKELFESE